MTVASLPIVRLCSLTLLTTATSVLGACSGSLSSASQDALAEPVSEPEFEGSAVEVCYRERKTEVWQGAYIGGGSACVKGQLQQLPSEIDLERYKEEMYTIPNAKLDMILEDGASRVFHLRVPERQDNFGFYSVCRYFECQSKLDDSSCRPRAVEPIAVTINGQDSSFNKCEHDGARF